MNVIVIEHVPVTQLPPAWRAKLTQSKGTLVTIRIEEEVRTAALNEDFVAEDPLFGMWRDREDMADVAGYIRSVRSSRFSEDDARSKD